VPTYQEILSNLNQGLASQNFNQYASGYGVPVTYNQDVNRLLVGGTPVDIANSGLQVQNGQLIGSETAYQQLLAPFLEKQTGEVLQTKAYETPEYIKQFIKDMAQQQLAPWNYNIDEDPSVQAARAQLEQSMSELAGKRGFLYGTAQQDIVQQEFSKIAPYFEEVAYQKNKDFLSRQMELAGVVMQWDDMQAQRKMKEAELIQMKADFMMQLSARDLEIFKVLLSNRRFEMELALDQQKFDMEKKEADIEKAWRSVNELGYANNETAQILGIKPGTEAGWVKKMIAQHQMEMSTMAEQHKYDLKMLQVNKKIEMDLLKEQDRVNTASQLRLMEIEYGYNVSLENLKEKNKREYEAKLKAEAEAKAKQAELEAKAEAESKAAEAARLDSEDRMYNMAKNAMEGVYGSYPSAANKAGATQLLYNLYKNGEISNPVYNRLIYEYRLPDYTPSPIGYDWGTGEQMYYNGAETVSATDYASQMKALGY
jgi:hypothetical protein